MEAIVEERVEEGATGEETAGEATEAVEMMGDETVTKLPA